VIDVDLFLPDKYYKSIFTVNYLKLKKKGVKCLLFDLDNTLVPVNVKVPTEKIKDLFNDLKDLDFKVIIVSNNSKKRVAPFKKALEVDSSCRAFKPLKSKFSRIMKIYKFEQSEIAIIGDQLLTDILGGNRSGITTILVNPVSVKDEAVTKISRKIEKRIEKQFAKKDLFKRGRYYE